MHLKFQDFIQENDNSIREKAEIEELLKEFEDLTSIMECEEFEICGINEGNISGLNIVNIGVQLPKPGEGVDGKALYVNINGHKYGYQAIDGSIDEIGAKFGRMLGYGAGGNALAWLKKNTNLVYGSVKNGQARAADMQAKAAKDLKSISGQSAGVSVVEGTLSIVADYIKEGGDLKSLIEFISEDKNSHTIVYVENGKIKTTWTDSQGSGSIEKLFPDVNSKAKVFKSNAIDSIKDYKKQLVKDGNDESIDK